jgi:hypothetical protein
MALRAVPEHPKFARLKRELSLPKCHALGLLEALWHFTGKFAPRGNVGKFTDAEIESWVEWEGPTGAAIAGLVAAGWLDVSAEHRLVVHDWHDHADSTTKKQVGRLGVGFVSDMSGHRQDMSSSNRKHDGPPVPGPVPVPVPVPEPVAGAGAVPVPAPVPVAGPVPLAWPAREQEKLSPHQLAKEVQQRCQLSDPSGRLGLCLTEQCRFAQKDAEATDEQIAERMSGAWLLMQSSKPKLDYAWGAEKFFGEGHWKDSAGWPWKEGMVQRNEKRIRMALDILREQEGPDALAEAEYQRNAEPQRVAA